MKTLDPNLIDLLEQTYGSLWWPEDMYPEGSSSDPFKHLIVTILSQNTSEARVHAEGVLGPLRPRYCQTFC